MCWILTVFLRQIIRNDTTTPSSCSETKNNTNGDENGNDINVGETRIDNTTPSPGETGNDTNGDETGNDVNGGETRNDNVQSDK